LEPFPCLRLFDRDIVLLGCEAGGVGEFAELRVGSEHDERERHREDEIRREYRKHHPPGEPPRPTHADSLRGGVELYRGECQCEPAWISARQVDSVATVVGGRVENMLRDEDGAYGCGISFQAESLTPCPPSARKLIPGPREVVTIIYGDGHRCWFGFVVRTDR